MSNFTGADPHGHVAHILGGHDEHHGEAGHIQGEFHAYTPPANDHNPQHAQAPLQAANDHPIHPMVQPVAPSFASKYASKALGQHATYAGMITRSGRIQNRIEHILGNVHHSDAVTRSALENWKAQADNENGEEISWTERHADHAHRALNQIG